MALLLMLRLEMECRGTACRARRFWANNDIGHAEARAPTIRNGIGHGKPCPYAKARLRNEPNASEVFCGAAPSAAHPWRASAAKRAIMAPALASALAGLDGARQGAYSAVVAETAD